MSRLRVDEETIVQIYPEKDQHKCGYCKSENGSTTYGMSALNMTVVDYQDLIDRGWRRSGKYCYKPVMHETCCPQYTIRCDALNLIMSKSQKKVIKKFNKYLTDGALPVTNSKDESEGVNEDVVKDVEMNGIFTNKVVNEKPFEIPDVQTEVASTSKKSANKIIASTKVEKPKPIKKGLGADSTRPPCKKAKLLRLERKKEKLLSHGMSLEKLCANDEQKSLEQFIEDVPKDVLHKLIIKLVQPNKRKNDDDWTKTQKIEEDLYTKYQTIVHNDPAEKARRSFVRFLVDSPLNPEPFPDNKKGPGYGSFHQQYWIDDKLIAVGVIDILPKCVSSVYFFYDPDFRGLTLGTYGSLRELYFTRSLSKTVPEINQYYMGYYIHTCPKMLYKGKLSPSYLLCPETYKWSPLETCIPKLDVNKYSRLNDDTNDTDSDCCRDEDINKSIIWILHKHMLTYFELAKEYGDEYANFIKLFGRKCCRRIIVLQD